MFPVCLRIPDLMKCDSPETTQKLSYGEVKKEAFEQKTTLFFIDKTEKKTADINGKPLLAVVMDLKGS